MADDETVQVLFRVPSYQKSEWSEHADQLGMGQSEFIRTMIQAGRRGFETGENDAESDNRPEGRDDASPPRGRGLETRVQTLLRERGAASWDDLLEELAGDFEDRLDGALESLQSDNRVQYSGRDGGYVLIDDGE
ncbi:MAG: DUF5805 domain-containing protein [Salinigranum sp.]